MTMVGDRAASTADRRQVWRRLIAALAGVIGLRLGVGLGVAQASGPPVGGALCPTRDCGYEYDPALGDRERGIPAGTPFDALPDDWLCPNCGTPKSRW